jgi:hypothetical protein
MSCGSVLPQANVGPGETTTSPWPQGLSRSVPIPSTFGVYSQVTPVVPSQPFNSYQYTDARQFTAEYIYTSTANAAQGRTTPQFRSQAERIQYQKAQLQYANCQ